MELEALVLVVLELEALEHLVLEVLELLQLEVLQEFELEARALVLLEELEPLELVVLQALELEALALGVLVLVLETMDGRDCTSFPCFSRFLSQLPLQPASPLPTPSPYTEKTGGLTERHEPESRPSSCVRAVRTGRRVPRPRPAPVLGTHVMALHPSSVPLHVPLLESSLPIVPDPANDLARAASPTISRLLAIVVTNPSFESTAASALVAELVEFAATCRVDYATALVAESMSPSPPSVG
ncbi:unnamed protein product, partial [Closterium sp. NIES-53]